MDKLNEFSTEDGYLTSLHKNLSDHFAQLSKNPIDESSLFEEMHLFAIDKTEDIKELSESTFVYSDLTTLLERTPHLLRVSHSFGQKSPQLKFMFEIMIKEIRRSLPFFSKKVDEVSLPGLRYLHDIHC